MQLLSPDSVSQEFENGRPNRISQKQTMESVKPNMDMEYNEDDFKIVNHDFVMSRSTYTRAHEQEVELDASELHGSSGEEDMLDILADECLNGQMNSPSTLKKDLKERVDFQPNQIVNRSMPIKKESPQVVSQSLTPDSDSSAPKIGKLGIEIYEPPKDKPIINAWGWMGRSKRKRK